MNDIKSLNDAELVEAVAREVFRAIAVRICKEPDGNVLCLFTADGKTTYHVHWIADMNDLKMVKDKFEYYEERKDGEYYRVAVWSEDDNEPSVTSTHKILQRAWLEAALMARGEK